MIKILFLIINVLISNYYGLKINQENPKEFICEKAIQKTNPNYELINIDDFYYDETSQPIYMLESILNELKATSIDNNVYFDESELDPSKELVQCNYSSFKEYVYNSNLTAEQIKNTLKGIEQYKPYELQDTTGINNIGDINTGDVSINGIGPEMDFDNPDIPGYISPLHIFTAGVGGCASDWSNDGNYSNNTFYLNTNSLPYKLKNKFSSDVYVATPYFSGGVCQKFQYFHINSANVMKNVYSISGDERDIDKINLTNNDIIIFNYNDEGMRSNDYVYSLLNKMLTEIRSEYNYTKFNLIGHSRGGIVNGMYAIANPSHIKGLYSIGTPYFENDLALVAQLVEYLASSPSLSFADWLNWGFETYCEAYDDLANPTIANRLRNGLNQAYTNYDFEFVTFGNNMEIINPFFIEMDSFNLRMDAQYVIEFDGLVDSYKAIGIKSDIINKTLYGMFEHYYIRPDNNYASNLLNDEKIVYTYKAWELIGIQNDFMWGTNRDLFAKPGMPIAVPHNLQTMQKEFHDYVLNKI